MLFALGLPQPQTIFCAWLVVNRDAKMSKSLGNVG